jgi:hypothetical protein
MVIRTGLASIFGLLILILFGLVVVSATGGGGGSGGGGGGVEPGTATATTTNIGILLFIGFMLVVIGVINSRPPCPPPVIEYRFIPRTFQEEQENPVSVKDTFEPLFNKSEPWIGIGQTY